MEPNVTGRSAWRFGITVSTAYVSTGDLASTMNSLNVLYKGQNATTGKFPVLGLRSILRAATRIPIPTTYGRIIGAYNYFLYSGDKASARRPLGRTPERVSVQYGEDREERAVSSHTGERLGTPRMWRREHRGQCAAVSRPRDIGRARDGRRRRSTLREVHFPGHEPESRGQCHLVGCCRRCLP